MAEENMTEQDAAANGDTRDEGGVKERGEPSSKRPGLRAARNLRRARQTYQTEGWQESGEAAFLLREATVLALMDLAAAIRESRDSPQGTSSG